jgi:hypothetical protein
MGWSRVAFLVLFSYAVPSAARAEPARSVTITVENKTPKYVVAPSVEMPGMPPSAFSPIQGTNKFEYKFPVSETDWFNHVNIKISWLGAFEKSLAEDKIDFHQYLTLRIRRDFPRDFWVAVYFSNDRTNNEMNSLEKNKNKKSLNDQYEVFFRSWQISNYYREARNPKDGAAKRPANDMFYAAVNLAEAGEPKNYGYVVEMSDTAEQYATESVGGPGFANLANKARANYWSDLSLVDDYVRKGDCDTAALLLSTFKKLKMQEPGAFSAYFPKTPTAIEEKEKIFTPECGKVNKVAE